MGRWEWIILELGFLGLLVWELLSVRRSIRQARRREGEDAGRVTKQADRSN